MMRYPETEAILRVGTMDLAIQVWVDSGFEGGITIPASMKHDILADPMDSTFRVADGHRVRVSTWSGSVELEGHSFPCEVIALGNQMLLGLEVMNRMDIVFERGKRLRFTLPEGDEFVQKHDP